MAESWGCKYYQQSMYTSKLNRKGVDSTLPHLLCILYWFAVDPSADFSTLAWSNLLFYCSWRCKILLERDRERFPCRCGRVEYMWFVCLRVDSSLALPNFTCVRMFLDGCPAREFSIGIVKLQSRDGLVHTEWIARNVRDSWPYLRRCHVLMRFKRLFTTVQ